MLLAFPLCRGSISSKEALLVFDVMFVNYGLLLRMSYLFLVFFFFFLFFFPPIIKAGLPRVALSFLIFENIFPGALPCRINLVLMKPS